MTAWRGVTIHCSHESDRQHPEIDGNPIGISWNECATISVIQASPDAWEKMFFVSVTIVTLATARSSHVRDVRRKPSKMTYPIKHLLAIRTNASSPESLSRTRGTFNGSFLLNSRLRYGTRAAYRNMDVYLNLDARSILSHARK